MLFRSVNLAESGSNVKAQVNVAQANIKTKRGQARAEREAKRISNKEQRRQAKETRKAERQVKKEERINKRGAFIGNIRNRLMEVWENNKKWVFLIIGLILFIQVGLPLLKILGLRRK